MYKIPVYLEEDYNPDIWKIHYNGFNIDKLESHLKDTQTDLINGQSLNDLHMPFISELDPLDYFDCSTRHDNIYYPIAIHWWHDFDPGVMSEVLEDNIFSECIELPTFILRRIESNNVRIILYNIFEGFPESTWQFVIDSIAEKYKDIVTITKEHFIIVSNNVAIKNIKSFPCTVNELFDQTPAYHETFENLWVMVENNIQLYNSRPFKGVCLLRRPRSDRWAIMTELFDLKSSSELLLSFSVNVDLIQLPIGAPQLDNEYWQKIHKIMIEDPDSIAGHHDFSQQYPKSFEKFRKEFIHEQVPFWITNDVNPKTNPKTDKEIWKFIDSYLHIVSETYFDKDVIHFSEKIFKPIWYMQPFVVFSTPYTLKHLKDLGYKTFNKWINESYDNIEDPTERMYTAIEACREFMNKPTNELNNVMKEMLPILNHNVLTLLNNREKLHVNLLKDLKKHSDTKWGDTRHVL